LSVVIGTAIALPEQRQTWTYVTGTADCAVRSIGYFEPNNPSQMPIRGTCHSIPLRSVDRLDRLADEKFRTTEEQAVPDDIVDLWKAYCALTPDKREQFLRAAAKWQEALLLWRDRSTLSYTLLVIACEALKPGEPQFRGHNAYHVVESLLGKAHAEQLQKHKSPAQQVRSAHLHRGEFHGAEFIPTKTLSSDYDPSFDTERRELAQITQAAIVEWLKRRGSFTMPLLKQRDGLRRWVKANSFTILLIILFLGPAAGWLMRGLW
jgi:hypothetical protein